MVKDTEILDGILFSFDTWDKIYGSNLCSQTMRYHGKKALKINIIKQWDGLFSTNGMCVWNMYYTNKKKEKKWTQQF